MPLGEFKGVRPDELEGAIDPTASLRRELPSPAALERGTAGAGGLSGLLSALAQAFTGPMGMQPVAGVGPITGEIRTVVPGLSHETSVPLSKIYEAASQLVPSVTKRVEALPYDVSIKPLTAGGERVRATSWPKRLNTRPTDSAPAVAIQQRYPVSTYEGTPVASMLHEFVHHINNERIPPSGSSPAWNRKVRAATRSLGRTDPESLMWIRGGGYEQSLVDDEITTRALTQRLLRRALGSLEPPPPPP